MELLLKPTVISFVKAFAARTPSFPIPRLQTILQQRFVNKTYFSELRANYTVMKYEFDNHRESGL